MSDTAVYERYERNLNEGNSPPCITARRGGCVIKQCRAATEETQPGWFSSLFSAGKPPRPRVQRRLRDILLIARPPLLAVMQGGELPSFKFIHTFKDSLQTLLGQAAKLGGGPFARSLANGGVVLSAALLILFLL